MNDTNSLFDVFDEVVEAKTLSAEKLKIENDIKNSNENNLIV